jgi:serine/threonine protein phosphatase 1
MTQLDAPRNENASRRTIAVGDVHGCSTALRRLIEAIDLRATDTLVMLGDYVDRGPDSRGVLELLIELGDRCRLVPLMGNHEEMMLAARNARADLGFWLACGGQATLHSYGNSGGIELVPREHFRFLEHCQTWYETETHFFVHANYRADVPLDRQDAHALRWLSLADYVPPPHRSGKIAVVGHTPQRSGQMLDLGHLKCLDTGCCLGGRLTALDVESGRLWQVDEVGCRSLCETCGNMREVVSGKGSRFLLCQLAENDERFDKYPPQPLTRCEGYCAQHRDGDR